MYTRKLSLMQPRSNFWSHVFQLLIVEGFLAGVQLTAFIASRMPNLLTSATRPQTCLHTESQNRT